MPDPSQKKWLSRGQDAADPRPEKTERTRRSLGDLIKDHYSRIAKDHISAAGEAAKEQPKSLIDSLLKVLGQNPGLFLGRGGRGIGLGRGGRGSILKPQVGAISKKPTLGALAVRRGAPGSKKLTAAPAAPGASLQPVDPMPLQHESLAGRRVAGPPPPEEGRRGAAIRKFSTDRRSFKELDIKVSEPKLSIEINPDAWIEKKTDRSQSASIDTRSYRLIIAADVSDKNLEAKNLPLMRADISYIPTQHLLYVRSIRPTDYGLFLFGKLTDDQYAEGLRHHKDRTMAYLEGLRPVMPRELDEWGTAEARGANLLKTLLGFESSRDAMAHIATMMRRYEPDAVFIGGHRTAGIRAQAKPETRYSYLPKALKETWKGYVAKPGWRSEIATAKKGSPGSLAERLQKGAGNEEWMRSITSLMRFPDRILPDESFEPHEIRSQDRWILSPARRADRLNLLKGADLSTIPKDVLEGLQADKFMASKDLFESWEDLLKDPRTDQLFPKGSAKRTELEHLIAVHRASDWRALGNMELFAPEAAADSPFDYEH
jgi:hypothetical protein